jgi:anti-sigma regulatory factor (Ser/Thr protein kinase)
MLLSMRGYPQPAVPGELVSYLELTPMPSGPFWARRHTEAVMRAWQIQPANIETAQLLVSELLTNSVRHAGSSVCTAPGELAGVNAISLTLRYHHDRLIIEVYDSDPSPPVLTESRPDAESGHGLVLVRALSKEWDYYLPPSGGKIAYCVIAV